MPSVPRSRLLLSLAAMLLVLPHGVLAHAVIVSAQPASGATIDTSAVAIRLRFNSRIDHARSRLKLRAPDGAEQALTPATDTPADEIDAQARTLSPGAWHLQWQVLSVDGHITRGDIPFNVR
ncbi:copper resistance protein CopC [Bradyrhizobium oligotrophicum S58]|uniref:Copper resistance protein CopC n=1 Tax=Bradyrhizobium oligotrophicum S58 TaxID=1245469 RepID=M4ZAF2_9BRAD|nr:copper resistance CopC family protein [Bradyrhizobium oligotrophicum]BAM90848.1 copper resistance protein CopC [Bradyrhizobium oligotrophicum S58]